MTFLAQLLRSKVTIWILLILPGLWPLVPIYLTRDPAVLSDPLKYLLHHFGFVACLVLVAVLTFSPLRTLWPQWPVSQALNRHRRLVGVAAFVYALLHLGTHFLYEGAFDDTSLLPIIFDAIVKKPFQLTGLIAFTILLILAVTSPHAVLKKLGGKLWKNLHRLVYLAAALVAYHQAAARKLFPVQVLWIFVPLALLEIARYWKQYRPKPLAAATEKK